MHELLRTNDLVLIARVSADLDGLGIPFIVLDTHMSILEGSIGAIPRRIMVANEDAAVARRTLRDIGGDHG